MKRPKKLELDMNAIMELLINQWRRLHKLSGPADSLQTREFRSVVGGVKSIMDNPYLLDKDYFTDKDILGAHLLYQWVEHYQEAFCLIGELPKSPERVLDICSGAAPFAFAALRYGATEAFAIDRSVAALEHGAEVAGRYGMALTIRKWEGPRAPLPVEGKFDLITVAHSIAELFPTSGDKWQEKQYAFIQSLLNRLTPDGYLLLVESSLPYANQRMLTLRDTLVEKGVPVQAPCVWKGECPALKAKSACYAQREMVWPQLFKDLQRAGKINQGSLKMSYLILRNPSAGWPVLPKEPVYRIISPGLEGRYGKEYYLCGTDGKKRFGSNLTTQPKESKAFDYLKRGELISIEGARETSYTIDVVEGTTLTVEAACNKPLPTAFIEDK
jgi:SAM-dependent methyltransferase